MCVSVCGERHVIDVWQEEEDEISEHICDHWGHRGEMWTPDGRILDVSNAGFEVLPIFQSVHVPVCAVQASAVLKTLESTFTSPRMCSHNPSRLQLSRRVCLQYGRQESGQSMSYHWKFWASCAKTLARQVPLHPRSGAQCSDDHRSKGALQHSAAAVSIRTP